MVNKVRMLSKAALPDLMIQAAVFLLVLIVSSGKFLLAMGYRRLLENLGDVTSHDVLILYAMVLVYCVALYLYNYIKKLLNQKIIHRIQNKILISRMNIGMLWWESQSEGKWQTTIVKDPDILGGYYTRTLLSIVFGVLEFLWAVLFGFFTSVPLTASIVLLSFLSLLIPDVLSKSVEQTQNLKQKNDELVREIIIHSVIGSAIIKVFSCRDFICGKFNERYRDYADSSVKQAAVQSKMEAINVGVGFVVNTVWMIIGIGLIKAGHLQIGGYVGFMVLCNCFNWPFFELSAIWAGYVRQKVSYDRLFENIPQLLNQKLLTEKITSLDAQHIEFKYKEGEPFVVRNFSHCFNTSRKYVICGENGVGKTTLMKLLSGLYYPQSGNVIINDAFSTEDVCVYSSIACVPQKSTIISGSIFENIECGRVGASYDEVVVAAKKAQAHSFIVHFPDSYATYVGYGSEVKLSEGQIQRISLARAFLKNADITFLDEPTSALDNQNAAAVLESIRKDLKGVVIISHKSHVAAICDEAIFLS